MTKDNLDSDSNASANDNPAEDKDFNASDAEETHESVSEADSPKVKKSPKKLAKKSPKKSPKKKASKKSNKAKKSPAKAEKRKSIIVEETDPFANSDDEPEPEKEVEEEYEVEAIVGHREYNGKLVYKIRWKGYGAASDTWEVADSLSCPNILEPYNLKNKVKTNKRKVDKSRRLKFPLKKRKNSDSGNDDASEESSLTESEIEPEEDSDDYEVDKLVEVRKKKDGSREFLVRWKKWSPKYDTWEPENNLSCPELIEKFMAENVVVSKKKTPTKERPSKKAPKSKKSITFSTQNDNRRSSKRTSTKVTYGEDN